jgi:hypothetical protein
MSSLDVLTLKKDIQRYGLEDPELFEVMNFKSREDVLEALYPGRSHALAADAELFLDGVLKGAAAKASMARRLEYRGVSPALGDALWSAQQSRRKAQDALREAMTTEGPVRTARSSGSACDWHPRKKVRRASGLGEADRLLMKKWGSRLAAIMKGGTTPSWHLSAAASDPQAAMAGLVGKSRPATLAKRVRAWEIFSKWLMGDRGRSWPVGPVDLVDYLAARVAEGCPPSLPEGFRSAVLWIEARSGLAPDEMYGRSEFFRKNVDRADVLAMTDAEAVQKAPRFPVVVIGALECKVMSTRALLGLRIMPWARLLKVYGTMRWDDLQRLKPRDVHLRAGGLVGRLSQTKTSGAGKKVRDLPLYIPKHAFTLQEEWLETGHALWSLPALGSRDRDYFLPRFTSDLEDTFDVPASSSDLATLGRLVLEQLVTPVSGTDAEGKVGWNEGPTTLVPRPLLGGWTGHSERCTLPSIYAAMGVPKSERDPLGRWSPTGSDDYVRTYRALVSSLAYKFRAMLAEGNVVAATDEEEAFDEARLYASRLGNIEPQILQESADRMWETAKVFYALWAMDPGVGRSVVRPEAVVLSQVVEDRDEMETARFIIVMSKKGAMLRLHRSDGCSQARALSFASYEFCDLDPVPQNLYSHYCHTCWPRVPPPGEPRGSSSSGSSSQDSAEYGSESS